MEWQLAAGSYPAVQIFYWGDDSETSGFAWRSLDQAVLLESTHHLMHGRRCHTKELLHVDLRGGTTVHARVEVNEREVTSLLLGVCGGHWHEGSMQDGVRDLFGGVLRQEMLWTCDPS